MDKNFLIELTKNLYQLTLLFPKKEPLRYKMREVADDILANSLRITNFSESTNIKTVGNCSRPILEELEVLDGFFEIAKNQNWVRPSDILAIQKEYDNLREELKKIKSEKNQEEVKESKTEKTEVGPLQVPALEVRSGINERQEKILEFLRENGRAQVWQIQKIFPEVCKRTLRRDFRNLLKKDIIDRIGERNDTFYQIKVGQA